MGRHDDYYYADGYGSRDGGRRGSLWLSVFDLIMVVVTAMFAVGLIVAFFTPYVDPSTFGSLTIIGIFAPLLYVAVLASMLFWLVRKRWITAAFLAVLVIIGAFDVSKFYRIDFKRHYEVSENRRSFTLMSYNVRGFFVGEGKSNARGYVDFFESIDLPDVLCLQEFNCAAHNTEAIDSLFEGYNMRETLEFGNVVVRTYSRFPIIAQGDISEQARGTSQWCDIVVRDDTIRIFNNHLYSMHISADDSRDISQGKIFFDDNKMRSIVARIRDNSSIRARHVDTLTQVIAATRHAKIVCGDFNDTPMSYVYRRMRHGMKDAFVEAGRGYGYTFLPMHKLLRIDYIMYSPQIGIDAFSSMTDCLLSDHLPIMARMHRIK
ncbi:MAG: endonuclease/exonuclease/phosphatase family protein [Alistipes sp.]|nr:endonuclease/exonuclease/phosphatase family protein [Alistipes sp.]